MINNLKYHSKNHPVGKRKECDLEIEYTFENGTTEDFLDKYLSSVGLKKNPGDETYTDTTGKDRTITIAPNQGITELKISIKSKQSLRLEQLLNPGALNEAISTGIISSQ